MSDYEADWDFLHPNDPLAIQIPTIPKFKGINPDFWVKVWGKESKSFLVVLQGSPGQCLTTQAFWPKESNKIHVRNIPPWEGEDFQIVSTTLSEDAF